jgi:hypothetical protein
MAAQPQAIRARINGLVCDRATLKWWISPPPGAPDPAQSQEASIAATTVSRRGNALAWARDSARPAQGSARHSDG